MLIQIYNAWSLRLIVGSVLAPSSYCGGKPAILALKLCSAASLISLFLIREVFDERQKEALR